MEVRDMDKIKGMLKESFVDSDRLGMIRLALTRAYAQNDREAIAKAAQLAQKYVDDGGDDYRYIDDALEDYTGNDPEMLTDQYILRLMRDRYCDDDKDQEYIRTGIPNEPSEKVFDLNEHGVCMNPNTQSIASGLFKAMIETAKIDGKWYYGVWFNTPLVGNVKGASKSGRAFEKEQDAIKEAAQEGLDFFKGRSCEKVPQFIFDELKKLSKPQPVQLSLFDF